MCSQIPALQMLGLRYMQKNAEHIQAQVQKRYTEIRAGSGPSGMCVSGMEGAERNRDGRGHSQRGQKKSHPFFLLILF